MSFCLPSAVCGVPAQTRAERPLVPPGGVKMNNKTSSASALLPTIFASARDGPTPGSSSFPVTNGKKNYYASEICKACQLSLAFVLFVWPLSLLRLSTGRETPNPLVDSVVGEAFPQRNAIVSFVPFHPSCPCSLPPTYLVHRFSTILFAVGTDRAASTVERECLHNPVGL